MIITSVAVKLIYSFVLLLARRLVKWTEKIAKNSSFSFIQQLVGFFLSSCYTALAHVDFVIEFIDRF